MSAVVGSGMLAAISIDVGCFLHTGTAGPADRTPARGPCGSTGWAHRDRAGTEPRRFVGIAPRGSAKS